MTSVVMFFIICKGERYCVGGVSTDHVGIKLGKSWTKVQGYFKKEPLGNFVWCLSYSREKGIIK